MYARAVFRLPGFGLPAIALTALAASFLTLLPAPPAQSRSWRIDRVERRVVRLVNVQRAAHGLHPVKVSRRLARSADSHSRDMARRGFFAHASSSGAAFDVRIRRFTARRHYGENLAYVPHAERGRMAARVVTMWMRSPGHRAVILSGRFSRVGVARRAGNLGSLRATVFTADFASRR